MSPELDGSESQPPRTLATSRLALLAAALVFGGMTLGGAAVWLLLRQPRSAAPAAVTAPKPLYQCPMHPTITADHPGDCPICGMKLVEIRPDEVRPVAAEPATAAPQPPLFQCPMHPTITSDHPGDCPICGMKLVEVKRDSATTTVAASPGAGPPVRGLAPVTIDATRQQLIGLRLTAVTRGEVAETWRTVARVQVDPTRVRKTNVKVEGYVERMFVDFIGKPVRKGEPLFSLYSPAVLAAEGEYVLALQTKDELAKGGALTMNGDVLVASARRKLELWDVPAAELARLERTREPSRTLTFLSPVAGVVTAKNVVEGARLGPGDMPYEITDLSKVWVIADAYETDLARVRVGMSAKLTLQAYPERAFAGEVAFIEPLLDPSSRTTKVHVHFANPKLELKPEMFGEVTFAGPTREGLRVPSDTIVRSGTKNVVFLSLGDGKFEPRQVQLGATNGDVVEVTSGLTAGQEVVSRANFLVDSESQLRASLAAIGGM